MGFKDMLQQTIIFSLLLLISPTTAVISNTTTPQWQELSCMPGYKYLFSEITFPWEEARGECELYGGWLVDIESPREQYCLLEYAHSAGIQNWFWTDINDVASEGVYRHAKDNALLGWYNWLWRGNNNSDCPHGLGYDAI